ncbi:MAG: hypothetical protein IPK19_08010 [Chloroflexi bacterium]|nr:hypothetical protein [Chloroflexota bacterium]
MRLSLRLVLAGALVGALLVVIVGQALVAPTLPLITEAGFAHEAITPNADGSDDITIFAYAVTRTAQVSLILEGSGGNRFAFRENELRTPQRYQVAFSGVVDGFSLPEDPEIEHEIARRLIPDDTYTWRLTATDTTSGEQAEKSGQIVIRDGDAPLPLLSEFTVFPTEFTPNQDGILDRTQVNIYLEKEADLKVYLLPEIGEDDPIFLTERLEDVLPNERGRHQYDYAGGVDNNADPPPDGTYLLVAEAQDAVGQIIRRTSALTIREGGKPYAEIVPQTIGVTVVFETRPWEDRFRTTRYEAGDLIDAPQNPDAPTRTTISMPVGDVLVFKLTVENYSDVPIRTTGPEPGTVYEWDQRAATFGRTDEPGAWRVGLDCTTAPSDYPWRWALGSAETLDVVVDPDTGVEYLYLAPRERIVVWGAVRLTEIEARNPQNCWAGLIHEDVEISQVNQNVGARSIFLVEEGG